MPGALAGLAAKKGLDLVLQAAVSLVADPASAGLRQWQNEKRRHQLYEKYRQIRHVKTLWHMKHELDLAQFYVPMRATVGSVIKTLHHASDLGGQGRVVVRGAAGQGKSILLRYLASKELEKGNCIPIFAELRRAKPGEEVTTLLLRELTNLGLPMSSQDFHTLAAHGRLALFLDGFDELALAQRSSVVTDLEDLCKRHAALTVVVSTRPHSGLEYAVPFDVVDLLPLTSMEVRGILECMDGGPAEARSMLKGKAKVLPGFLTTPLRVVLFKLRHQGRRPLPDDELEFYHGLLKLMLRRHDASKPGFVRARQTTLGDHEVQEVFGLLCFLARKEGPHAQQPGAWVKWTQRAATALGVTLSNPQAFLDDLCQVTGLLVEEGEGYTLAHTSVGEFHAALFVSGQQDAWARRFYAAMKAGWKSWKGELHFLSLLDWPRYAHMFLLPQLRTAAGIHAPSTVSRAAALFDRLGLRVMVDAQGTPCGFETKSFLTRVLAHLDAVPLVKAWQEGAVAGGEPIKGYRRLPLSTVVKEQPALQGPLLTQAAQVHQALALDLKETQNRLQQHELGRLQLLDF